MTEAVSIDGAKLAAIVEKLAAATASHVRRPHEGAAETDWLAQLEIAADALIERLADARRHVRDLYHQSLIGIFRTGLKDGFVIAGNDRAAQILGYESADELIGKIRSRDLYVDPVVRDDLARQLQTDGRVDGFEAEIRRPDGNTMWISLSAQVYLSEGYLEGAMLDITSRKRAEIQARQAEKKYRSLFEQAADCIFIHDADGVIREVNQAAIDLLGYNHDELVGMNIGEIEITMQGKGRSFEDLTRRMCAVLRETGKPRHVQGIHRHKSGRTFPVDVRLNLLDIDSPHDLVLAFIRDVSERKAFEEQLAAQAQAIRELSTPIIEVWDGVLALPVLGYVDSLRAQQMTEALLAAISQRTMPVAILDMTGVETMDTATTDHLLKLVRSARLLGTRCVISGISSLVAKSMVALDLEIESFEVFSTLRAALHAIIAGRRPR